MKNESRIDRLVRLVLALAIFIAAFLWTAGYLRVVLYVIAVVMLITSVTGFCLLYKLCEISTVKEKAKKAPFVKPTNMPAKKPNKAVKKK